MTEASEKSLKVACIATDGFEYSELTEPVTALRKEGMKVEILSTDGSEIRGWRDGEWTDYVHADSSLTEASPDDYDALLIPGGALNCDSLRQDQRAVAFVQHFIEARKPISAICHGPQLLIEADGLIGREVTSYPAIRIDVENAGALWTDEPVVVDNGLTTSRSPKDLPQFIEKTIEEFREGVH